MPKGATRCKANCRLIPEDPARLSAPESGAKITRPRRRGNAPSQNIVRSDRPAIIARVGRFLRCDHRAFDRRAREKALAPAIGVDGRCRSYARLRITAYGPGGCACVDPERDIAVTGERADGGVGVEHKDKVGDLRANLRAPTGAASPYERRPGPASAGAGHYDTLPAFAAHAKTHLDYGQDRETPGPAEHASWDALFRHPPKVSQNSGGLTYDFLFGRRTRRRERKDARKQKDNDFFHGYNEFAPFKLPGRIQWERAGSLGL